jgi:hypothetical protein
MISSPNYSSRNGAKVRLVVVHTAEGARTTAALGNYFANASVQASSHVGIDETSVEQYVDYSRASWTVRAGNPISDNAELCGFAAWTRDQWLNEHRGMLNLAAKWVRERCLARGIPIVKLTPAQVAAGQAGVIGHIDWTLGMRDGTHTDPGNGFPWDVVINTAANGSAPTTPAQPRLPKDNAMYIKCKPDATKPDVWVAILSGSLFIGLGSPGEKASADLAIKAGATEQWVEKYTWDALDQASHRLHDNPRPVTVHNLPVSPATA